MSATKFMEAWTRLVAAAETKATTDYARLLEEATAAWAELPEQTRKNLQGAIFTFNRPSVPAPKAKVGDVTLGPACKEKGCNGQLRREVLDVREVCGQPIVVSRLTCTLCGEHAFDDRIEPKGGVVRALIATLLSVGIDNLPDHEFRYDRAVFEAALNYDLRVGHRETDKIAIWVSPRESAFQPGADRPAKKEWP